MSLAHDGTTSLVASRTWPSKDVSFDRRDPILTRGCVLTQSLICIRICRPFWADVGADSSECNDSFFVVELGSVKSSNDSHARASMKFFANGRKLPCQLYIAQVKRLSTDLESLEAGNYEFRRLGFDAWKREYADGGLTLDFDNCSSNVLNLAPRKLNNIFGWA